MFRVALLLIVVTLLAAAPVMGRGGGHGGGGHCGGHAGAVHGFGAHGFGHGIGTCGAQLCGGYGFSGWEYLDRFDPTPGRDVLEDADASDAQSASAQYRYDHRSGGD